MDYKKNNQELIDNIIEVLTYTYQGDQPIRIDKYLTQVQSKSRTELKNYFDQKLILVNQKPVKPSYLLNNLDQITLKVLKPQELQVVKEKLDLDIIYEDDDIMVINKPSGMVVHPANGHYQGTLVNALMYHSENLSTINGIIRPGIVHRIDKDTSGLLVVCKNDQSHWEISQQLKDHKASRKYYAIVYGAINHNLGKIDAPIGRDLTNRQQMAVVENGKPAVTHFKVIERFGDYTLIEARLETGRTHQIRVHLAYIGHPVLGDPVYGPKKVIGDDGQFLHAKTLGLIHPKTNQYMEFDSPLPEKFNQVLETLRKNNIE